MQPIGFARSDVAVYAETSATLRKIGDLPDGYCTAGIVLPPLWEGPDLVHELNSLFGGTFEDKPFRPETGARSFYFCGDRASEAHALCDALRDGWFHRNETVDDVVLTVGETGDSLTEFVDDLLLIGPGTAAKYMDNLKYIVVIVPEDQTLASVRKEVARSQKSMREGREAQ